jgi:hypothetical protein
MVKSPRINQKSAPSALGTGLGTSKGCKSCAVPSEATPDKRDIVFDFISHNPKVASSNLAPATTWFHNRLLGISKPVVFGLATQ